MKVCSFFGASSWSYTEYEERLKAIIVELIEKYEVEQFYSGGRGNFDKLAASTVGALRGEYPFIKNTLVLSYMPPKDFILPTIYTDTVYLLERRVPPRYAILETNKAMIDRSDFVVTAARFSFRGAQKAREYALKKKKRVIDLQE